MLKAGAGRIGYRSCFGFGENALAAIRSNSNQLSCVHTTDC
jgi:hypothetical protein